MLIPTELNLLSNELLTAPIGAILKFTSGPRPIKNGMPVKVPKLSFNELFEDKLKLYQLRCSLNDAIQKDDKTCKEIITKIMEDF